VDVLLFYLANEPRSCCYFDAFLRQRFKFLVDPLLARNGTFAKHDQQQKCPGPGGFLPSAWGTKMAHLKPTSPGSPNLDLL